jgi:hypothetical protein
MWTEHPFHTKSTILNWTDMNWKDFMWTKKFQKNARLILQTDACRTKGCFGGVLKILVAKDAMDSLVLFRLGYAPVENVNWNWFLRQANEHVEPWR